MQSYSQPDIDDYLKQDHAPPGGPSGPPVALRVVGIERRPLDLSAQDSAGGILVLTPGFLQRYHNEIGSFTGSILRVRTRHGAADTRGVVGAARRIFGDSPSFDVQASTNSTAAVQDAVDVLTVALWVFAAVAALAGVVAVGIVVQRQLALVVDRARAARDLARVAGSPPLGPQLPVEVERLRQIDRLPTILAGFLAALGVFAIGHALVTSVRRRRRDFAVLKTLGFDRRQVRATVAWQATTLATVGLVLGVPLGVVVGRLVWGRVADGLGISTTGAVPVIALMLLVPAAVVLANLIAALPARAAARTRPAVVLRSE